MSKEAEMVAAAVARGTLVAAQIETHRIQLEQALLGLARIGGANGMRAAVAGALIRVERELLKPWTLPQQEDDGVEQKDG